MENKQQKLRKKTFSLTGDKKSFDRKSLLIGSVIATIIASTPYLFYLHLNVPNTQVWDNFLFTYDSKDWGNANTAMWVLTGKGIPLMLLFIWFFTNRHWWYHALLVPIAMYVYQIADIFNSTLSYVDEFHLIYLIPIMAVVIPSIYLIRARIFNRINEVTKSLEELEEEFKISPKNFWKKIKQYF